MLVPDLRLCTSSMDSLCWSHKTIWKRPSRKQVGHLDKQPHAHGEWTAYLRIFEDIIWRYLNYGILYSTFGAVWKGALCFFCKKFVKAFSIQRSFRNDSERQKPFSLKYRLRGTIPHTSKANNLFWIYIYIYIHLISNIIRNGTFY